MDQGKSLIIGVNPVNKNTSLIEILKKSREWNDRILRGEMYVSELARRLGYKTPRYVENVLRLRFLSPTIQKMILVGTQKTHWTNKHLFTIKSRNWSEQEKELGL